MFREFVRGAGRLLVVQALLVAFAAGPCVVLLARARAAQSSELEEVLRLARQARGLYDEGRYDEAIPLGERAAELCEKKLGAEHPAVASMLNNLALFYEAKGDYARVEALLTRAAAIYEKARGPEHPHLAAALDNLGGLYKDRGDYARAEPLYRRSLAILEKAHGPDHPEVAKPLNNLALLYSSKGDGARAEAMLKRALSIFEKAHGPEHRDVASAAVNLARLYEAHGDYARAEPLAERALAVRERALGANHPDTALSLNGLANVYAARGERTRAEPLFQRALAIQEQALGPEHPALSATLVNLAVLAWLKGETASAARLFARATDLRERELALVLTTGSEEQKRLYLTKFSGDIGAVLSFHLRSAPRDPEATRLALNIILRRKGRALDAMSGQIEALRRRASPEDRALLERLAAARSQLANMQLKGAGRMPPARFESETARLASEAERLEAEVGSRSAEFRAQSQPVTFERVRAAIPTDAALVEIALYKPYDAKARTVPERFGAPRYAAYVLAPGGEPRFADLGAAAQIDAEVEKLRAALRDAGGGSDETARVKQAGRAVDEQVMRPVRALLGATRRVLLAPDGALNLIPFAALVDERGRYLVEDYTFTYLTSGRDLLRLQLVGESKQQPLVLADPSFGAQQQPRVDEAAARRSADMTGVRFTPLPGTADEAKALGPLLGVAPLTRERATEAALKQVAAPRVLHVATHGFFLADQPRDEAAEEARGIKLVGGDDVRSSPARIENPLLRSGIALAGANERASAGGEDGILTALEVAGLDLWGTKLVVLSACETGVGKVANGEGVYGLRRALVLAGSESQLISLWQVSDEATRDLMVAYYKRLQSGEGRTDALRAVQLAMLRGEGRDAAGPRRGLGSQGRAVAADRSHPYFWAAFIQSGDWRGVGAAKVEK